MILRFELTFLPFVALNFHCNLLKDVFIIEPFPWFCIDCLDWGDVLGASIKFEDNCLFSFYEVFCFQGLDDMCKASWSRNENLLPHRWLLDSV
jgi:hypothetical protein